MKSARTKDLVSKIINLKYSTYQSAAASAARVDFAGAEPIIGLEFVIMLATARELTQPRALRSHYLDHDGNEVELWLGSNHFTKVL